MNNQQKKERVICRQCDKRQTCRVLLMPTDVLIQICSLVQDAETIKRKQHTIVSFKMFSTLKNFIKLHIN